MDVSKLKKIEGIMPARHGEMYARPNKHQVWLSAAVVSHPIFNTGNVMNYDAYEFDNGIVLKPVSGKKGIKINVYKYHNAGFINCTGLCNYLNRRGIDRLNVTIDEDKSIVMEACK